MLFVTEDDKICRSQVFPFFYYAARLRERFGAELREVPLATFRAQPATVPGPVDTVCLQTWFDLPPSELRGIVSQIRAQFPSARLAYLDWFAPTDLRLAEVLHEHVDVYVKKHVFRDRSRYGVATRGDTNLMEHYGDRYGLAYPLTRFPIPDGFLDKLLIGPSFFTADYMLGRFAAEAPPRGPRPIDVHARIGAKGSAWYARMRRDAIAALEAMRDLRVVSTLGVRRGNYLRELAASKLCFSPFGYGEICWRDYEAVLCGTLLLKPDTSHVQTDPDIFVAGQTYVPIRWDFADLADKVRHYLRHEEERREITVRAWNVLRDYVRSDRFVTQLRPLFA